MRPFNFGLNHQLLQPRVQMRTYVRIIDLREWGATSAMEKEHMTFSSDQFSHRIGKVSAVPIQQNNDAFFWFGRIWEHPVKRFDYVRPQICTTHFSAPARASKALNGCFCEAFGSQAHLAQL